MRFQRNILLKNYTTFKIGGPAKYFCVAKNKEDLIGAVSFAKKEKLPYFILGGGSNLLVSDKGFNGLVIKFQASGFRFQGTKVFVDAGLALSKLVSITANAGLSGLEWASGIPQATVGGAIRGNAGAFDYEMKDIVRSVEAFNSRDFKIKNFVNKKCQFSYRSSIFKKNSNLIIISAELKFKKDKKIKIEAKVQEISNYRESHHSFSPSAGSVFKNTESVPTALLIHRCGLTGKKIGGAQISKKHSNFIINSGKAKAKDVLQLIDLAKKEVKNKFGVEIEEEIRFLS